MPSFIPFTFITSSGVLKGRASIMAWALAGPISGKDSNSSLVAVLRLILWFGVVIARSARPAPVERSTAGARPASVRLVVRARLTVTWGFKVANLAGPMPVPLVISLGLLTG